jgi:hypothetical protein
MQCPFCRVELGNAGAPCPGCGRPHAAWVAWYLSQGWQALQAHQQPTAAQAFGEALRVTPPAEHVALAAFLPPDFLTWFAQSQPAVPVAAPAAPAPRPLGASASVAGPSARARVGRRSVDGDRPFLGLYFTVNDSPAQVLKVMDATTQDQLGRLLRSGNRTLSVYALLALGFSGFVLDSLLEFQSFVVGYAGLVCWAAALVLNRSIARQRAALLANSGPRSKIALPATFLSLVALVFLLVFIAQAAPEAAVFPAAALTLLLALLVGERSRRTRLGGLSPFDSRFDEARRIFAVLKDDLPRKYPLLGWLDLTGLSETKAARETLSDAGAPITFYRDEWLRLKLKLKDGNVLRLSAVESVRKKKGFMKRGRRRSKWKPGQTTAGHQLRISVLVNRERHQIRRPVSQQRLGEIWLDAELTNDDRLVVTAAAPERMSADTVLRLLKHAYDHVTPHRAAS